MFFHFCFGLLSDLFWFKCFHIFLSSWCDSEYLERPVFVLFVITSISLQWVVECQVVCALWSLCTVVFVLHVSVFCYGNHCPPSAQSCLPSLKYVSKLNRNTLFPSIVTTKIHKMTCRNINCRLILKMHGWILATFYFWRHVSIVI